MQDPLDFQSDSMMTDINMTPLIDVMLVLLIVFMVTLPVLHHAVKVDLPQASSSPQAPQAIPVDVSIDRAGAVFWNGEPVNAAALEVKLSQAAAQADPPALQLYADREGRYDDVATTLAAAQRAGLTKIRFILEPAVP